MELLVKLMQIATAIFSSLREMYVEKGNYIKYSLRVTSRIFWGFEGLNGSGWGIRWDYFTEANV